MIYFTLILHIKYGLSLSLAVIAVALTVALEGVLRENRVTGGDCKGAVWPRPSVEAGLGIPNFSRGRGLIEW